MSIVFIIFCVLVFIVELAAIYSPLYYLSYCVLHVDKKIGDNTLSTILLIISILLAILFLPSALTLCHRIFN